VARRVAIRLVVFANNRHRVNGGHDGRGVVGGIGSAVGEATVRVLVIRPAAVGVTTTVKLVRRRWAACRRLQTTFPPRLTQPGEAETNVTLAGKASVSVTLEAETGPEVGYGQRVAQVLPDQDRIG
jgi:hypothetical protein